MKIKSVKSVGTKPVYDLSIDSENYDEQQYVLDNGVVSHNTGAYYSADAIWIIGRQQEKDGTEIAGYHFVINIEKSRHVRERSKIPITVTFDGGISKWSGLMDVAEKLGYLRKPKVGWYEAIDPSTGEVLSDKLMRAKEVNSNGEFWKMMFEKTDFASAIKGKYTMATRSLMSEDEVDIAGDDDAQTEA